MPALSFAAALLLSSSPAGAFKLGGWIWDVDQLPVVFYETDYLEDSLPQEPDPVTGRVYQEDAIIRGFCNWHWTSVCDELLPAANARPDASCAFISYDYGGIIPGNEGNTADGTTKIYFDDPDEESGAGVLAVTNTLFYRTPDAFVKQVNGTDLYRVVDSDITFNDGINWGTTDDIDAGCSGGEMSIEAVATHEIGHLWGMGHSCDEGEPCNDHDLLDATMYWVTSECNTAAAEIAQDDIQGITSLYGPFATFSVAGDRSGGAPLDVQFQVDSEFTDEIVGADWNFGDGTTSTELEPLHTYDTQGQFTVSVTFEGQNDECGQWSYQYREPGFVLACEAPVPEFYAQATGDGQGLVYQMINTTDISTYGCVDAVEWRVYPQGQGADPVLTVGGWSPKIEFPEAGTWRVVMEAGGPGGFQEAELTIDAGPAGCSSGGGRSLPGAAAMLLALGLLRRRRS